MVLFTDLTVEIVKYLPYKVISKLCKITNICNNKLLWLKLLNLNYSNDSSQVLQAKYIDNMIINLNQQRVDYVNQYHNTRLELKRRLQTIEADYTHMLRDFTTDKYFYIDDLATTGRLFDVLSADLLDELATTIIIYGVHPFTNNEVTAINQILSGEHFIENINHRRIYQFYDATHVGSANNDMIIAKTGHTITNDIISKLYNQLNSANIKIENYLDYLKSINNKNK